MKKTTSISVMLLLAAQVSFAQIYWNFGTVTPGNAAATTNSSTVVPSNLSRGNNNPMPGTNQLLTSTSASSGYAGVSGSFNAGAAAVTGALGLTTTAYFEVTLTADPAKTFTLTGISFGSRSTTTGPQAYAVRSSVDTYVSDLATGSLTNNSTWALNTNGGLSVTSTQGGSITFRIYGYNGAGSASNNVSNWRIDDLSITVTEAVLPVTLVSFEAVATKTAAQLRFVTATEQNNDRFEIERSADGRTYTTIGIVKGAGNATETQNYTFEDKAPLAGTNYYRLRQVDFDGTYTYSPVRSLVFGNTKNVVLFPTPTAETMSVQLDQPYNTDAQWQIVDMTGRLISEGIFAAEQTQFAIPVATLVEGAYVLRITAGTEVTTKQFRKI
jgi:hypothetical protein